MNPDAATISVPQRDAEDQASPRRALAVFLCANCARPARAATSAGFPRPVVPDFGWPFPVRQTLVSCTGRLQPEHVLKAFESGSEAVCMVACQEDDCHYLEGSKRCARRAAFLRSILEEIGLGGRRLLLFHLPGTAAEDMALGSGRTVEALGLRGCGRPGGRHPRAGSRDPADSAPQPSEPGSHGRGGREFPPGSGGRQ